MSEKRSSLEAIAGPVSRETFDSLVELERQLAVWNQRINLVADTTLPDAWKRHVLDSAQLLRLTDATNWADIGSGAGFPGLIIAVLLKERPGGHITLIESNAKKTAFLKHVVGLLDLPASVVTDRIESAVGEDDAPQVATARALAALPKLLELTSLWLAGGTTALFHKGREYRKEVQESADSYRFDLVEHRSLVDPESVILEISGFSKR